MADIKLRTERAGSAKVGDRILVLTPNCNCGGLVMVGRIESIDTQSPGPIHRGGMCRARLEVKVTDMNSVVCEATDHLVFVE